MRKRIFALLFLSALFCMILTGCGASKYDQAVEFMTNGDYKSASDLLSQLPDDENAKTKLAECNYHLGTEAMSAEDWDAAIGYFDGLNYDDSATLLESCQREKGMTENADYEFLAALEKSILDRLDSVSNTNYDNATVVNTELVYVEKFQDATFYDSELSVLANKYIEGLHIQKEALKKENAYEVQIEWQRGLVYRYEVLYDLFENYDFLADNTEFVGTYVSACADQRALLDAYDAIEADIGTQTTAEDFMWWIDGNEFYCTLVNNTEYKFSTIFEIAFIDVDGVIFEEASAYIENITAGSSYKVSFYVSNPDQIDAVRWINYYDEVIY